MSGPQEKVLNLIFGRWRSQILYAGVKLGVFDALRNGPNKATAIAHELGLDPHLTYRLLRALGSLGLLSEDAERTFSLTETVELLRSDHPQTLRGVTLEQRPAGSDRRKILVTRYEFAIRRRA
jgi:methyltransferase family protein